MVVEPADEELDEALALDELRLRVDAPQRREERGEQARVEAEPCPRRAWRESASLGSATRVEARPSRSLRGRASQAVRAPGGAAGGVRDRKCPTCFAGLAPLAAEYAFDERRAPVAPTTPAEHRIFAFLRDMDAFIEEYLATWS